MEFKLMLPYLVIDYLFVHVMLHALWVSGSCPIRLDPPCR